MRLVNPMAGAFYVARDDGSLCCGKLHGTAKAANRCADKPPKPAKQRRAAAGDRDRPMREEDTRVDERAEDARRFLRGGASDDP